MNRMYHYLAAVHYIPRYFTIAAERSDNWRCDYGESNINTNQRQCGRPTPKALIAAASTSLNVRWPLSSQLVFNLYIPKRLSSKIRFGCILKH
jgi:hypothetical protein